jgi:hypothetical protein
MPGIHWLMSSDNRLHNDRTQQTQQFAAAGIVFHAKLIKMKAIYVARQSTND